MNTRTLGTDFEVSAVGLGCMGFSHAYGAPMVETETIQMLRYACELGYTFFDTAEIYGTPDDPNANERVAGEALQPIRNHVKIASKFGIRFDYDSPQVNKPLIPDSRPEVIRASVEGSLKRLRTDHIDLYYQHRMDPAVEPETVAEVMAELIKEGKVLHWGISEADENYLRRAHAVCPVTAVQNRYSMMARQHEALFPVLEELKIGFVAFSPMANGFLTGKYGKDAHFDKKYDYRSNMPQFTPEAVEQNRELLTMLHEIAGEHRASPAQISMAWMLCKKPWIVPIPGTRKPERLRENAGAAGIYLSPEEVADLDDLLDQIPMSAVFGGSSMKTGSGQREDRFAASR
ncbi:MAG: aldo/keto reductase [Lachnospiraceae bacterium]|nr:aldo/keto reductase [Lachnospiraceae bacterium]